MVTQVNYMTQAELDAYNQANGTSYKGSHYVRVNPQTGEEGIWLFNPQGGWMDITTSLGPRTHYENGDPVTSFSEVQSGINPNWVARLYDIYRIASGDNSYFSSGKTELGLNQDLYNPYNWRNDVINYSNFRDWAHKWARGSMTWDEIYQGMQDWYARTFPDSTTTNSTTANNSTTTNNSTTGAGFVDNFSGGNTDSADQPIGWYWGSVNGQWQWLPVYQGEGAPTGASYVAGSMPGNPPSGWVDPNAASTTNNNGTNPAAPGSPPLYTPDASMFFSGLFSAADLMNRNGGQITSPFYDNARQQVLNSLAQQAAAAGRTQNTAEEIRTAQNMTPSLSARGLFNPDYAALLKDMGL